MNVNNVDVDVDVDNNELFFIIIKNNSNNKILSFMILHHDKDILTFEMNQKFPDYFITVLLSQTEINDIYYLFEKAKYGELPVFEIEEIHIND